MKTKPTKNPPTSSTLKSPPNTSARRKAASRTLPGTPSAPRTRSKRVPRDLGLSKEKGLPNEESPQPVANGLEPGASQAHLLDALTQGHRPAVELSVETRALFRSFQNNLVSLVSHELRTPLMGISNSLALLSEWAASHPELAQSKDPFGMSLFEILSMATRNSGRLTRSLQGILDAVELGGGSGFAPRLKMGDPLRVVESKCRLLLREQLLDRQAQDSESASLAHACLAWKVHRISVDQQGKVQSALGTPSGSSALKEGPVSSGPQLEQLFDPARFGRAVELWIESLLWAIEPSMESDFRPEALGTQIKLWLEVSWQSASLLSQGTSPQSERLKNRGFAGAAAQNPDSRTLGGTLCWKLVGKYSGALAKAGAAGSSVPGRGADNDDALIAKIHAACQAWLRKFSEARLGFEGGVGSSQSLFSAVLGSETDFLARNQEGLGHELLLVHEILAKQEIKIVEVDLPASVGDSGASTGRTTGQGEPMSRASGEQLFWSAQWRFAERESGEILRAILQSRAASVSHDLASIGVVIFKPLRTTSKDHAGSPDRAELMRLEQGLRSALYRSTDTVYSDQTRGHVWVLMDDCKEEDFARACSRMQERVRELGTLVAARHCPTDFVDPLDLLQTAPF